MVLVGVIKLCTRAGTFSWRHNVDHTTRGAKHAPVVLHLPVGASLTTILPGQYHSGSQSSSTASLSSIPDLQFGSDGHELLPPLQLEVDEKLAHGTLHEGMLRTAAEVRLVAPALLRLAEGGGGHVGLPWVGTRMSRGWLARGGKARTHEKARASALCGDMVRQAHCREHTQVLQAAAGGEGGGAEAGQSQQPHITKTGRPGGRDGRGKILGAGWPQFCAGILSLCCAFYAFENQLGGHFLSRALSFWCREGKRGVVSRLQLMMSSREQSKTTFSAQRLRAAACTLCMKCAGCSSQWWISQEFTMTRKRDLSKFAFGDTVSMSLRCGSEPARWVLPANGKIAVFGPSRLSADPAKMSTRAAISTESDLYPLQKRTQTSARTHTHKKKSADKRKL